MIQTFEISGRLPSLNEYTAQNRANPYAGASAKKSATKRCAFAAKVAHLCPIAEGIPVDISCHWVEPTMRRDPDNIAFAIKFVLDGLVEAGILGNDTHKWVKSISHTFAFDKRNPHVEVTLETAVGKRRTETKEEK